MGRFEPRIVLGYAHHAPLHRGAYSSLEVWRLPAVPPLLLATCYFIPGAIYRYCCSTCCYLAIHFFFFFLFGDVKPTFFFSSVYPCGPFALYARRHQLSCVCGERSHRSFTYLSLVMRRTLLAPTHRARDARRPSLSGEGSGQQLVGSRCFRPPLLFIYNTYRPSR